MARKEDLPFISLSEEPLEDWFVKHKPPMIVEPKFDGHDLLIVQPKTGSLYAINRHNTFFKPADLPFLEEVEAQSWPLGTMVRGEMYVPGGRSSDVVRAIKRDPGSLHCVTHDILFCSSKDLRSWALSERLAVLGGLGLPAPERRYTVINALGVAYEVKKIEAYFQVALNKGFEGIVVKPLDSIYKNGAGLKLKKEITWDVLLTGVVKQHFKNGIPWSWRMEAWVDGNLEYVGEVSSAKGNLDRERGSILKEFSSEDSRFLYFNESIPAEITALEMLKTNGHIRFRHPVLVRLRDDKPAEQCIIQVR